MVEVERTNERCIFLIANNNLKYYIVVPFARQVKIMLGLVENVDDQKVKDFPVMNDTVIVVPVINEAIVNYLKIPKQSYGQALNYFNVLISNVQNLLLHNKKEFNSVILFNNSVGFENCIDYFVSKVPGKLVKSDNDLLISSNTLKTNNVNQDVMASDIPVSMNAYPNGDIVNEEIETQSKGKSKVKKKDNRGEPGFVSYVLLGVVIAIVSLVFLYMLI